MISNLWESEKSFWLDGRDFYRKRMSGNALMVFPKPVGILRGDEIVEGLKGAPRWQSVDFDKKAVTKMGDAIILAYEAAGRREGSGRYSALCCSTYIRERGEWRLLAHQQTPF
jgi:Domain of unknown function (DUF4440)